MAVLFPPVEPRPSIVGTGMSADPESIEELQNVWARQERASLPPKKQFEKVLAEFEKPQDNEKNIKPKRQFQKELILKKVK